MPVPERASRRRSAAVSSTLVLAFVLAAGAVVPAAVSAPSNNKVTICHRTHSVTNPYRLITVNANAADGVGSSDHSGHNLAYEADGMVYPIFDPTVSYPPNQKHWGDIIPPVRTSPGLNWTVPGAQDIYWGSGSSFGLCGRLSAKQFYDLEVAAGVDPLEVLADLDDQGSLEDAALKSTLGISSFTELDPNAMPAEFDSVPAAPQGVRPPAGYAPEPGRQKLAVFVWYDLDRDGAHDEGEPPAPGVAVSVGEALEAASAGVGGASALFMTAGDLVTDTDGLAVIDTLTVGQWSVVASVPSDTVVTHDSEGTTDDGQAQVDVPADSAGFAWVGLVSTAAGPDGGGDGEDGGDDGDGSDLAGDTEDQLAATGNTGDSAVILGLGGALVLIGFALARVVRPSRRRVAAR